MHEDVQKIVSEMTGAGCTVINGRKHLKIVSPRGRLVTVISKGNSNVGWELLRRMRKRSRLAKEDARP